MKRFITELVDVEGRFSLGCDQKMKLNYLSIPVANRLVDYDEYYQVASSLYQTFLHDRAAALRFANECRLQKHDDLLILKPGRDRGSAI